MPNWVSGPDGEKAWKKAKGIVREQYGPELEESDPDRFYSLVTTVYKSVCKSPDYSCGIGEDDEFSRARIFALAEAIAPFCEAVSSKKLREAEQMMGWHEQDAANLRRVAAKQTGADAKATLIAAESHEKAAQAFGNAIASQSTKDLRVAKQARKEALLATRNRE